MSNLSKYEAPKSKLGKELKTIYEGLAKAQGAIIAKTQAYKDEVIYDAVEAGWWANQAKAKLNHGQFTQFKLDTVSNLGITERTLRRYMAAATNVGLTANSTLKEIEAMRKHKQLHGVKPTLLYKAPVDETDDEEQPKPPPPPGSIIEDEVKEVFQALAKLDTLRGECDPDQYDRLTNELHARLEEWTDCSWQPRLDLTPAEAAELS